MEAEAQRPVDGWRRALLPGPIAAMILAVAVPVALSRLDAFDVFFNLAQGDGLLRDGFPRTDPFSPNASSPWFPHEWVFSVLVSLAVRVFGAVGIGVLGASLLAISLGLYWRVLSRVRGERTAALVGLFALVLATQVHTWDEVRAYYLGNLLVIVALWLVWRWREGSQRALGALFLLTAIWANCHGSWIVGPALLGSTAAGLALDGRRLDRRVLTAGLVALALPLTAVLTPETWATLPYPFQMMSRAAEHGIREWGPLSPTDLSGLAFLALLGWAVAGAVRARSVRWASALPALGLTVIALRSGRHAPVAALLVAVVIAEGMRTWSPPPAPEALRSAAGRLSGLLERWTAASGGAVTVAAILLVLAARAAASPVDVVSLLDPRVHPPEAIRTLCTLPPGPVLNRYRFGALISAVCGPSHQVFVDGRADNFPQRVHDDYRRLVLQEEGWQEAVEAFGPSYVLWTRANHGSAFHDWLAASDAWELVLEERAGTLWRRRD